MFGKISKNPILLVVVLGIMLSPLAWGDTASRERETCLKNDNGMWFKVIRECGEIVHREITDPPPALGVSTVEGTYASVLAAENLYLPYQTVDVGSWPEAAAVGDVNNDGLEDVVMTTSYYFDPANDHCLFVFLQTISGTLDTPVKYPLDPGGNAVSVQIGDVDQDGLNDVVVGNRGKNLEILYQDASGALNPGVYYNSSNTDSVKVGDFNNDGRLDVAGIGWATQTASVWLQNTGGTLDPPVSYSVTHGGYDELDAGDVNNDGLTDLVVMSGQGTYPNLGVLLQTASGGFSAAVYYDLGGSELTNGVAVGDVTGDNLADITVSYGGNRPSSKIGVFAQDSYGTMDPAVVYSAYDIPEPVILGDADNDSLQDVIVAHGGWNSLSIFAQAPDGSLQPYQRYTIPYASHYKPQGLDAGDINNDGELDIVLADYNNGLVVLYHKSVPSVGVEVLQGSVPENGGGSFVFHRSTVNLDQSLVVYYTVEGGAEAGSDYQALSGYAGFPAGVDSVQVPVTLVDDDAPECDETIVLTLSDRPEYNLMPQSSAVLTILENDQTVVGISAPDDSARERGFKTGKFTLSRTGNTGVPLTVTLDIGGTAVNGVDYQAVPDTVTFAAGVVSIDIYISPFNDKLPEGQESVEFEITDTSCLYTVNPQSFKSTVWIND